MEQNFTEGLNVIFQREICVDFENYSQIECIISIPCFIFEYKGITRRLILN